MALSGAGDIAGPADSGKDHHVSSVNPWRARAALSTAGNRARRGRTRETARTRPVWCLGDSWYSARGVWVFREPVTAGLGEQGAQRSPRGLRGAAPELKADPRADGSRTMLQDRLAASVRADGHVAGAPRAPRALAGCPEITRESRFLW